MKYEGPPGGGSDNAWAGSERVRKTGASRETLEEMKINRGFQGIKNFQEGLGAQD